MGLKKNDRLTTVHKAQKFIGETEFLIDGKKNDNGDERREVNAGEKVTHGLVSCSKLKRTQTAELNLVYSLYMVPVNTKTVGTVIFQGR